MPVYEMKTSTGIIALAKGRMKLFFAPLPKQGVQAGNANRLLTFGKHTATDTPLVYIEAVSVELLP